MDGGGGGGEIAVNFGNSDFGSGDNFQSKEVVTVAPKEVAAKPTIEKEILISENEEAPAIVEVKKPATKIVKTEVEKSVVKPIPKPSKTTSDALSNLLKAKKYFRDFSEIEYRLGSLYFKFNNNIKGKKHLERGLAIDYDYYHVIKDLFPEIYNKIEVMDIINDFKNTSL